MVGCCVVDFIATVYLGKLEFSAKQAWAACSCNSLRLFSWCGAVQFPIYHFSFAFFFFFFVWLKALLRWGMGCAGAYDEEEAAARAYDLAALKYWGAGTVINFKVLNNRETPNKLPDPPSLLLNWEGKASSAPSQCSFADTCTMCFARLAF